MIERAYKKLALDALVIQQGRLAEQKSEAFVQHMFSFIGVYYFSINANIQFVHGIQRLIKMSCCKWCDLVLKWYSVPKIAQ